MVPKQNKFPTIGQIKINTFLLNSQNLYFNLVVWSNYPCRKIVKLFQSKYSEFFTENSKYCLVKVKNKDFLNSIESNIEDRINKILEISSVLDSNLPIENQLEHFEFCEDSFYKNDIVILIARKFSVPQKISLTSFKDSNKTNDICDDISDSVKFSYPWDIVHPDDNLVKLTHLTQEFILKKLYTRFRMGCFYSYIDNILIFINPYCILPIYNPKYCNIYRSRSPSNLPPHIYGLTADLYYTMIEKKIDQCVLISGESGSGKTESSKQIIRQITFLNEYGNFNTLISAIMVSSTVLEAFGNAKNSQNINSSRFGNLTEIFFSNDGLIICARLKVYMLEKSRIVLNNDNETNFHVFYYMLSEISHQPENIFEFEYLKSFDYNNDQSYNQNELRKLKNCLSELNFCLETQNQLFSILLAILHIGNIEIENSDINNANNIHFKKAAELLYIDIQRFNQLLTTLSFELLGEKIKLDFSASQIKGVKDSIAKIIYSFLFDWIVYRINYELKAYILNNKAPKNSIKILDIFGFENSKINSFEEFCINYVNECLQNFLNQKTLKIQQDEYVDEGLEWRRISYLDNTPVVELYVHKPYGLFNLLEDECKIRDGSDIKLYDKMNIFHKNNEYYSNVGLKRGCFTIRHYAGPVLYDIKQFREKNINEMNKNIVKLLRETKSPLLRAILIRHSPREHWNILRYAMWFIFGIQKKSKSLGVHRMRDEMRHSTDNLVSPSLKHVIIEKRISALTSHSQQSLIIRKNTYKSRKKKQISEEEVQQNHLYISSYFQKSLNDLSDIFSECKCYFIKCIKSNNNSLPVCFDFNTVLIQLKYTGVVQTILIRQAGYSYRYKKDEFFEKYRVLFKKPPSDEELKDFFIKNEITDDFYRIGKTLLFFKDTGIQILGNLKTKRTEDLIIKLQFQFRSFIRHKSKITLKCIDPEILNLYLYTTAKMIAFRKYRIAERDNFVMCQANKMLNRPLIVIRDKANLSTESNHDLRAKASTVIHRQKPKFVKRCFSTAEPDRRHNSTPLKFSETDGIKQEIDKGSKDRSTSTDTQINENVFNTQSEIELEDPDSKSKPLVLFTKKFWLSKIRPTKGANFSSNLFTSIIKDNKIDNINSESNMQLKPNININNSLNTESSILLKTEHDLFTFYTFLNQKITELNGVRNNVRDSFLKNNHADNYFAGCLSSFVAVLFVKFKNCIQKNEFHPIATKEIYTLFEDSVSKYSKVDRDENSAQIVFKNALYGIICEFITKKKSIFKKRSFDKLIKQIKESEFKIEGHLFETYKIYANSTCEICNKTIWENALICNECKMLIHKDCRTDVKAKCRLKSTQSEDKKFFNIDINSLTSFNTPIPPKLWELIEQIETRGLKSEGIYRITGNIKKTKEIMFLLDNVENKDLAFLQDVNPHVLASTVKHFLRHLPNPIVPTEVSFDISNSAVLKKTDMNRRFWKIVGSLPVINRMILDHLSKHLAKVASCVDVNKMSTNALAIVISPCLFKHEDIDCEVYKSNLNSRIKFVEFLIQFKLFCINSQDIMIGVGEIPDDFINS